MDVIFIRLEWFLPFSMIFTLLRWPFHSFYIRRINAIKLNKSGTDYLVDRNVCVSQFYFSFLNS